MNITSTETDFVRKKNPKMPAAVNVAVVINTMKKSLFILTLFVLFTILIKFCPIITMCDEIFIASIQKKLSFLPYIIPLLPDKSLYSIMIAMPLICGGFWGLKNKKYIETFFLWSIPLVTFLINCIVKNLIQRERPPFELQPVIHPNSFSYVSSHSLVTFCLWAFVSYLVFNNSKSKNFKVFIVAIACIWTLFVGFSRVWIGVHNPSDVIGAYLLGWLLFTVYIDLIKLIKTKLTL